MAVEYLSTKIEEARRAPCRNPYAGMTRAGYTCRRGAPTSVMIRLAGERRWRRLMVWQFSNAGTCFVRIKGKALIVRDVPEVRCRNLLNPEGLSWEEWEAAARFGGATAPSRDDWQAGVDPTEIGREICDECGNGLRDTPSHVSRDHKDSCSLFPH